MNDSYLEYLKWFCIDIYYDNARVCKGIRKCLGGHSHNRRRLLIGMAHAHRYLKGDEPFDPTPIFLSRAQWQETIVKVNLKHPQLNLVTAFGRSGFYALYNDLVELGFLSKKEDPNDKRGALFSVRMDNISCAPCISNDCVLK